MRKCLNQQGNRTYLIGKDNRCARIKNGKPRIDHCRGAWGHLLVNLGLYQGAFKGIELVTLPLRVYPIVDCSPRYICSRW